MIITYTPLHIDALYSIIENLPKEGKISLSQEGLVYLDISDHYIHDIFPYLPHPDIKKPEYFNNDTRGIGAHISIFYPQELITLKEQDLFQTYHFEIKDLVIAKLDKYYYALRIFSPTLLDLRKRYGLGEKLAISHYLVDLHITIGVKELTY